VFELKRRAGLDGVPPLTVGLLQVARVHELGPVEVSLGPWQAGEFGPVLVEIIQGAIGLGSEDDQGHRFSQDAESLHALPE